MFRKVPSSWEHASKGSDSSTASVCAWKGAGAYENTYERDLILLVPLCVGKSAGTHYHTRKGSDTPCLFSEGYQTSLADQ